MDCRQPHIDVVTHGRFGVKTIEVQNIDAAGRKSFARLVEARTDESRERFVIRSIVRGDLCKRRLIIAARMLIATPRIDPKTSGARFVFRRRLAKGEIAFAPIDAQLDEQARFHLRDEIAVLGQVGQSTRQLADGCRGANWCEGRTLSSLVKCIGTSDDSVPVRKSQRPPFGSGINPVRVTKSGPVER